MGRMQRCKGARWEREVASALREIFGEQVCRGWQTRDGADDPDVKRVPRQWVEAKHHHRVNIAAAMRQATEESSKAGGNLWPVVYSKSDRDVPLVTMRMSDFLVLLKEWWEWWKAEEEERLRGVRFTPGISPQSTKAPEDEH